MVTYLRIGDVAGAVTSVLTGVGYLSDYEKSVRSFEK